MKFILSLSIAVLTALATTNGYAKPTSFPASGLSIDAPPGLSQTKAGTALIDEAGETIILFSGGVTKSSLETDPTWRMVYRNPPEKIDTKDIQGNLYKRTRVNDGGKWDGWFLSVSRGEKSFVALASYTGNSQDAFERIRKSLLTIRWDDSKVKSEEAMGVHINPEGLQVVPNVFGGLSYNGPGRVGAAGPSIHVQLMPIASSKTDQVFPTGCDAVFNEAFAGSPHEGPIFRQRAGIESCEAWSTQPSNEMRYVSLVKLPSGALLILMGTSSKDQFNDFLPKVRRAAYELSPIR